MHDKLLLFTRNHFFLILFILTLQINLANAHPGEKSKQPGADKSDTAWEGPLEPLMLQPVAGITSAEYEAPLNFAVPLGTTVQLKQPCLSSITVKWEGATELERTGQYTMAACSLNEVGFFKLRSSAITASGTELANVLTIEVLDIGLADIKVKEILPDRSLLLSRDLSQSEALERFFAGTVPSLVQEDSDTYWVIGDYNSLPQPMTAMVSPSKMAPLIEWRADFNNKQGLGERFAFKFHKSPGSFKVSAGPLTNAATITFNTFTVSKITPLVEGSWIDAALSGMPIPLTIETNPPGFEQDVYWLASTKFGAVNPTVTKGKTATVTFANIVDEVSGTSWAGVIAGNAPLSFDLKCQQNSQCNDFDPCTDDLCVGGNCTHTPIGCDELTAWNDVGSGTWEAPLSISSADLDRDGDVDDNDLAILNADYTGAGIAYPIQGPPLGPLDATVTDPNHPADFDGDGDIDDDDVNFLLGEFTGPGTVSRFAVNAQGVGAPLGDPSQLSYHIEEDEFLINGVFQDPLQPRIQWEFVNYGGTPSYFLRTPIFIPAPVSDTAVQDAMLEHGFDAQDIADITPLLGNTNVAEVFEGFVHMDQNTVGQINLYVDGNLVPGADTSSVTNFGIFYFGAELEDGTAVFFEEKQDCTDCFVRVWGRPSVCVCNGEGFTFKAMTDKPGGIYTWTVNNGNGLVKVVPTLQISTSDTFSINVVGTSADKNDKVTVSVSYVPPAPNNNLNCQNKGNSTFIAVDLTTTFDPPPGLTTPSCTGPFVQEAAASRDGYLLTGAQASAFVVGIDARGQQGHPRITNIQVNTVPQCDECCKAIRVGLIQNITANSSVATYENNATITNQMKNGIDGCAGFPFLDTEPEGTNQLFLAQPFFDEPDGKAFHEGSSCGMPFDLEIGDSPSSRNSLCAGTHAGDVKLQRFTRTTTFKTYLVSECPMISGQLKCLYQWNWQMDYDVEVSNVDCTANPDTSDVPLVIEACAQLISAGACNATDFGNARKSPTDKVFNECEDATLAQGFPSGN